MATGQRINVIVNQTMELYTIAKFKGSNLIFHCCCFAFTVECSNWSAAAAAAAGQQAPAIEDRSASFLLANDWCNVWTQQRTPVDILLLQNRSKTRQQFWIDLFSLFSSTFHRLEGDFRQIKGRRQFVCSATPNPNTTTSPWMSLAFVRKYLFPSSLSNKI